MGSASRKVDSPRSGGGFVPDAKHLIRFRPDIEGLRAVAVMLVVADHLEIPGFKGGFLGVDVFFVISGFLITSLLAGEFARSQRRSDSAGGSISIGGFYMRRARRILPASLLVIACALAAGKIWFNEIRFEELQADALWATFFGANLHLMQQATDYFQQGAAVSPLQNYWSLAVEEQFYVVWPAIFVVAGRAGWKRRRLGPSWRRRAVWRDQVLAAVVLLTVASLAWSIIATANNPAGAYFSPFTRAYELGIGAIVAMSAHRLSGLPNRIAAACGVSGLLLFILGMVVIGPSTPYPGAIALIPTLGAALIITAGLAPESVGPAATALSVRPARFLGRISYSLYLWHWPIIVFAAALYPGLDGAARVAVLLPLSIAIAYLSYRFVEQPFRTIGKGMSGPIELWRTTTDRAGKLRLEAMLAAAVIVLAGIAAWARPVPPPADLLASATPQIAQWATYGASGNPIGEASNVAQVKPDPFTKKQWVAALNTALADNRLTAAEIKKAKIPKPYDPCFRVNSEVDVIKCRLDSGLGSDALEWPSSSSRDVVLFGNSIAAQWRSTIVNTLPPSTRFWSLTLSGCHTDATPESSQVNVTGQSCGRHNEFALERIAKIKPGLVIVSNLPDSTPAAMANVITRIKEAGAREVLWLGPLPQSPSMATCVKDGPSPSGAKACNGPRYPSQFGLNRAYGRTATTVGASFLDLATVYCSKGICPGFIAGIPLRVDGTHLSQPAMDAIKPFLREAIAKAVGGKVVSVATPPDGQSSQSASASSAPEGTVLSGDPSPARLAALKEAIDERKPTSSALSLAANASSFRPDQNCFDMRGPSDIARCSVSGSSASAPAWPASLPRTVALVGDSYAGQWRLTLGSILPPSVKVVPLTATSCRPAAGPNDPMVNSAGIKCGEHTKSMFAQLRRIRPGLVVASSETGNAGLTARFAKQLKAIVPHLLWIGYVPRAKAGFDLCLKSGGSLANCNGPRYPNELANDGFANALEGVGVPFWNVSRLFCLNGICPAFIKGYPVRSDASHLTVRSMQSVSAELSAAVQAALR